jgi:predicted PP-loop superfamily ATPase
MLYALYRLGYHSRATVRGFRAMASTALNEMEFPPDVIERQLAHQERNAVRAAYRAEYLREGPCDDEVDSVVEGGRVVPCGGRRCSRIRRVLLFKLFRN